MLTQCRGFVLFSILENNIFEYVESQRIIERYIDCISKYDMTAYPNNKAHIIGSPLSSTWYHVDQI